jgi:hypothetical protein
MEDTMQSDISYHKAIQILQLNKQNITIPHTLINFRSMIVNDDILDNSHSDLMKAKNVIIRTWIEEQLQNQGHWDIKSPYRDKCKRCYGTGEIYKLEKEKFKKPCTYCSGNGYLWLICKNCRGSGRYIRKDEEYKDLIINVKCNCDKFAKHYGKEYKGKIRVRCRECRGTGIALANLKKSESWKDKDFRYTGKIYSTTKCPQCHGYGFPVTPRGFVNPVLSNKLSQIINTESTVHEDPLISDPPYIIHKIPVRTVHSMIDPSMLQLARESI